MRHAGNDFTAKVRRCFVSVDQFFCRNGSRFRAIDYDEVGIEARSDATFSRAKSESRRRSRGHVVPDGWQIFRALFVHRIENEQESVLTAHDAAPHSENIIAELHVGRGW